MIIRGEVLFNVLTEGRLEDVKVKYPGHEAGIDNLSKHDPSGNNKYLAWMAKSVLDQGSSPKHVIDAINYFHTNVVRFEKKDINQYKTLQELLNAVEVAKAKVSKKEVKEQGVEKIYDDENVTVVHPKTHAASCKYGANTKWCVTMKNNPDYFRSYSSQGPLFFFMDKRRLPNEPGAPRQRYWKIAAHVNIARCNPINYLMQTIRNKGTKESFMKIMKDCASRSAGIVEFYNASDTYVTKKTVEKYMPNTPAIMTVILNYVMNEIGRFYDLYKQYDDEIRDYEIQRSEWLKHKNKPVKFVEAALEIPEMGKDLIYYIKMVDPEADITEIENLIKANWTEKAKEMASKVEVLPEPKRPSTKQPSLSWYDRELDQKLDNDRRNGR
jgi:hypothetical protein